MSGIQPTIALICIGEFPNELKHADVIPVYKKSINVIKPTTIELTYFQLFQKFLRKLFTLQFTNTSMTNYLEVNVDFVKDLVLNTAF